MATLPRKKLFALVGESHKNPDGSNRQALLQNALPGEEVWLQRDPDNEYDQNCVLVVDSKARAIGLLSRDDATLIAPLLDSGSLPKAYIHELTGGLPEYPNFGCVISVVWENRVRPEPRRLRPEQEYYEHAPIWEKTAAKAKSSGKRKNSSASLFKILLKALKK